MGYIQTGYRPSGNDLICEFCIRPREGASVRKAAEDVAAESSIGTWTEVETMSGRIKDMGARVFEIKGNTVKIAYPGELFEPGNMPQIFSSVAGNIFGMKTVQGIRLQDMRWPEKLIKSFRGPVHGMEGVRKLLKVGKRPLTGTIVKPKLGLNEKEHAQSAYDAWCGGVDIVKDDENLSSMVFNRFEKRVTETLRMRDRAEKETGERKMYMPNVTAETREMVRRAEFVEKSGGEYAMVDIITCGWSGLQTLREANERMRLVLHAHRAGHAAFTRNPEHGISMLVVAQASRIIGVDQVHIGTAIGKMEGRQKDVKRIAEELLLREGKAKKGAMSNKWDSVRTVFPVCSGGLHPALIPELISNLGNDIIIQAGGGVWGHPDGGRAGAKAVRQAVDASMENVSLKEYAKGRKELAAALRKWA